MEQTDKNADGEPHKRGQPPKDRHKKEVKKTEERKEIPAAVPAPEQGSNFSMMKYMCFAFIIMQLAGSLYQFYFLFFPTEELHVEEARDKYINLMRNHQPYNISVYLLDHKHHVVSEIWKEGPLHYNYSEYYPIMKTLELPVIPDMKNNQTVYLKATITAPNFYFGVHREKFFVQPQQQKKPVSKHGHQYADDEAETQQPKPQKRGLSKLIDTRTLTFTTPDMPIIQHERSFEIHEKNLMEADTGTESSVTVSNDTEMYPYLKSILYINLMHDQHGYAEGEFAAKQLGAYERVSNEMYYSPMFYVNDFWTLKRHLVKVNSSMEKVNLTVGINMISPGKYIMSHALSFYESYPDILAELKEVFVDANVYLLAVTMVVSLLHSLLDILTFKNDVQFWMTNKSFKGISVKSVFVQIAFDVILFLYVLDSRSNTSTYILITMGLSIAIDAWKVTRVCKFSLIPTYPFVKMTYQQEYTASKTDDYDWTAIKFMSYFLFPLFLGYSGYSFMYKTHKGYYSFVIGTLAGGVYLFGFILMTPQLYINYRLQSVGHLPWRALFYRFLNTIIDDLFSFVIKMPTLHRVACFRDDVIFVIYLYQRYKYQVDPKRSESCESAPE